jgi:F-type H+-transporting ATPase subunit alpha
MKRVVGGLKSDLAQYRELAAFAQFGSDLDRATQRQLDRGARLMELLKQPQYEPYSLAHQVMLIFVGTRGMLDQVPVEKANEWSRDFLRYMDTAHPGIGKTISESYDFTSETEEELQQAVTDFNANWSE